MNILQLQKTDIASAHAFWNGLAEQEVPYKKLSLAAFTAIFTEDTAQVQKCSLAAFEGDQLIGFANGCYKQGMELAYLTFVGVSQPYRRRGIAKELLATLESCLQEFAPIPLKSYDCIFFNPINLEWCVPGTQRHDHPNSPGVDVGGSGYLWLKNCGYRDVVYQNSFYRPLADFAFSPAIAQRMESLKQQDISIAYYDPAKHSGMAELFEDLGSEDWKTTIMGNISKPEPLPVLIAIHQGKAIGFTGPLAVQESGRGYFAGIGIHSAYRKFGLGKALFSSLCMALKEMGAGYMTLFTGETNPARNIYESAGFKIVKTWADMKKEVK